MIPSSFFLILLIINPDDSYPQRLTSAINYLTNLSLSSEMPKPLSRLTPRVTFLNEDSFTSRKSRSADCLEGNTSSNLSVHNRFWEMKLYESIVTFPIFTDIRDFLYESLHVLKSPFQYIAIPLIVGVPPPR
jgi:hypothetical protein